VTTLIGFRNVRDPRALARILEEAEAKLAAKLHPDPYISAFGLLHWPFFFSEFHSQLQLSLAARNGRKYGLEAL
jgi:hypothetical protein